MVASAPFAPNHGLAMSVLLHALRHWPGIWLALLALHLPFQYHFLPNIGTTLCQLWHYPLQALSVVPASELAVALYASDTEALYRLAGLLLLPALGLALWLRHRPLTLLRPALAHYLALQLLVYGMDKVLGHQFPTPESNLLYTPLGQLTPDMIFWSSIGIAPGYERFLGWAEVVIGLLLLYRRTRPLAALLALPVLAHVVVVNIAYDISVKLHATQLLLTALYVSWPALRQVLRLLWQGRADFRQPLPVWPPVPRWGLAVVKGLVVTSIMLQALYPLIRIRIYKGNQSPLSHPAWHFTSFQFADADSTSAKAPRRLFYHTKDYLIVQWHNDSLQDYRLTYAYTRNRSFYWLTDPKGIRHHWEWQEDKTGTLSITGTHDRRPFRATATKLPVKRLPALQQPFHWTVESVRN